MKLIQFEQKVYEKLEVETGYFFRARAREIQSLARMIPEEASEEELHDLSRIAIESHQKITAKIKALEKKLSRKKL